MTNNQQDLEPIREATKRARSVFITAHDNCLDATGSICALLDHFKKDHKRVYPFLQQPVLKKLLFLPHARDIITQKPDLSQFDVCMIVDAGDARQTGMENEILTAVKTHQSVVNIDHHKTNNHFGHLNLIDETASSTCELLYYILSTSGATPSKEASECLLTGIIGDTGNFTNAATTEDSFRIAAHLIWNGAHIFRIIENLVSTEASINTLRLWGRIFERLTHNKKYDIAISYVTLSDITECKVSAEAVEIVANLLNYIKGIKAGILLKEITPFAYKVSLRSTYPGIDVSRLAKMLGGGGHQKAGGFTVYEYEPYSNRY